MEKYSLKLLRLFISGIVMITFHACGTSDIRMEVRSKPQIVRDVTPSGFILANRIEVKLKGIEPSSEVQQYLSAYKGKKIRLDFAVKDDFDLANKQVTAYVKTTDRKFYFNKYLLEHKLASLDMTELGDSLRAFEEYANANIVNPYQPKPKPVNPSPVKPTYPKREAKNLAELVEATEDAVFMVYALNENNEVISQGTGFFINGNGRAISNNHVFDGGVNWYIKTYEQQKENYALVVKKKENKPKKVDTDKFMLNRIVSKSERYDYIVFDVDINHSPYLKIAKERPSKGEDVFAIGNPEGLENTVTTGIVSAFREEHMIQMSTPITHGSSGSPVMNMQGEVIGLATSGSKTFKNGNFARDIQLIINNMLN